MPITEALEEHTGSPVRFNSSLLFMSLLLGLVAFLVLTPLLMMILNSFQVSQPGEPVVYGLQGWQEVVTSAGMLAPIYNTFSLAITRQIIALVLGIFLAWLLARTDIPMRGGLEFMFWISFFLPVLPVTMGWILLLDPNYGLLNQWLLKLPFIHEPPFNIYSFWGIIWAHLTATTLGIKVMLLTPAFRNMDAVLEESSRISGASALGTLVRIITPVMTPAILVTTVLGIIRSLEAFEIELLLGVPIGLHVYSTKIHELVISEPPEFPPAMALGTAFLGILLLLVILQRMVVGRKSYTTVTGRGFTYRPTPLGRWKYPAFALVLLLAIIITVVPIALLVMGTFMKLFGFFHIPEPWTLDNWRQVLKDPVIFRSLWNTIFIGLGAGGIGILLYALIAYVIVKTRFAARGLLDLLSWLPWSIPGILLGIALLWTFLGTKVFLPIYGTLYILIIAMVIKSMPFGTQLIKSVMLQLGSELEEASRITGASWFYTYRRILFPLLFPALLTVGLVVFISAARDIGTVVLLATGRTRTLSLLMLDFATEAEFERATVVAVIIVILVVVAAFIARTCGGRLNVRGGVG
ncbi:MAG: iron ABC transporter permease [Deltaproteobacteria bacterium]|nr:iron ABC transporter permease [Deltaproteobacteria bacterium]MCZ6450272.1 iron ABC transporter permease [Deltaproteobacteria bacterium]